MSMDRLTMTENEMNEIRVAFPNFNCSVKAEENSITEKFCDKVCDEFQSNCPFKKMANKLKTYEDAEEQGLLLKLPCKVGDTVYSIECNEIKEFTVSNFDVCMKKIYAYQGHIFIGEMGLSVFTTKEEAEAALAEMEG